MASSQKLRRDEKTIVRDVSRISVHTEEIKPPKKMSSKFATLEEWLSDIIKSIEPSQPVEYYFFGLVETKTDKMIFFVGKNSIKNQDRLNLSTAYRPKNMFFLLPKENFSDLNQEQIIDKLFPQLKNFVETEEFKNSFLTKANSVGVVYKGAIWKKSATEL